MKQYVTRVVLTSGMEKFFQLSGNDTIHIRPDEITEGIASLEVIEVEGLDEKPTVKVEKYGQPYAYPEDIAKHFREEFGGTKKPFDGAKWAELQRELEKLTLVWLFNSLDQFDDLEDEYGNCISQASTEDTEIAGVAAAEIISLLRGFGVEL